MFVLITFSVESLGKYYFSKAESTNINSVQSRTQRLRSRPLIQTMIPGFLTGLEPLNILLLDAVRVQEGACFHHRFCAFRRSRASMDLFLMAFTSYAVVWLYR